MLLIFRKENCWFLCSVVQEYLGKVGNANFTVGDYQYNHLGQAIRKRIIRLLMMQDTMYNVPALVSRRTKLYVSIELGLSWSAVVYAYFRPGDYITINLMVLRGTHTLLFTGTPPLINAVNRWPNQDFDLIRVPSVLLYDQKAAASFFLLCFSPGHG